MLFVLGVLTITAALVYGSYVQIHKTEETNNEE